MEQYRVLKPDLITMDILMPGLDGLEAARKILEEDPDAKILMISSLAYDETIEESKNLGAKGFLYKPFEAEDVLQALDKIFAE